MTGIIDFLIGIFGRIVSDVFNTYIVRLLDKMVHKNNRPCEAVIFPTSTTFPKFIVNLGF